MIDHPLLMNLVAYSVQVACIAAIGTVLHYVLRIDAPAVRHAGWRCLLVVCLLLPWTQMRQSSAVLTALPHWIASTSGGEPGVTPATAVELTAAAESAAAFRLPVEWPAMVLAVVVAGGTVRLLWVAIGLWRLRRLRRAGEPTRSAWHDELQRELGTGAEMRYQRSLAQPVTFGILRPVVILPEALRGHTLELQRAVVAHELHHVRRRDWVWLLAEEVVRAAFWFHPAVWWLVSRIQLTREEVVDAAVVASTGERRVYVEALLAFADAAPSVPAAAFSRRRHLFTRIVLVSKEAAMSSRRIAASSLVMAIGVGIGGWYSAVAFPLQRTMVLPQQETVQPQPGIQLEQRAVPSPTGSVAFQRAGGAVASPQPGGPVATAPRPGQRVGGPAPVPPPQALGPLERSAKPITPENPIPRRIYSVAVEFPTPLPIPTPSAVTLTVTLDASGQVAEARLSGIQMRGDGAGRPITLSGNVTVRDQVGRDVIAPVVAAAIKAVKQWRYDAPYEGPLTFDVVVPTGAEGGWGDAAQASGGVTLQADRIYVAGPPAVVGNVVRLNYGSVAGGRGAGGVTDQPVETPAAGQAIRVGGAIRPPIKTRHVDPEYPAIAKSARAQGVVILEATIDADGRVVSTRVLRSIPLLDQAATDAVRQWEFTPTLLNGAAVPVVMTVTVQFSLPATETGN